MVKIEQICPSYLFQRIMALLLCIQPPPGSDLLISSKSWQNIREIITQPKYRSVKEIKIDKAIHDGEDNDTMKILENLPGLKKLTISGTDLSHVSSVILASLKGKVKHFILQECQALYQQAKVFRSTNGFDENPENRSLIILNFEQHKGDISGEMKYGVKSWSFSRSFRQETQTSIFSSSSNSSAAESDDIVDNDFDDIDNFSDFEFV